MQSHSVMRLFKGPRAALVLALALALFSAGPAHAGNSYVGPVTWYVTTTGNDANSCMMIAAPCQTINGAIGKAAAGDIIKVAVGTYTSTGDQVVFVDKDILLSGGWDESFTTQDGSSTIDGEDARRAVTVSAVTAEVSRLTIQHGVSVQGGGGIYNAGTLTVNDSSLRANIANIHPEDTGGAISNQGTMTINRSVITNNTTADLGGSGNLGDAGAIRNAGTMTISNTTISGNISGTSLGPGGIRNSGELSLQNSTVTRNSGYMGGGLQGLNPAILRNTILAGNLVPGDTYAPDCFGPIISAGYNLIGNNSGCSITAGTGDLVGTGDAPINPRLGPLTDHGGPTFTHGLASNSPAVNAGNPDEPGSSGDACLATDQRGVARPVDGRCDIGAYEGSFPVVLSIVRANSNPTSASTVNFTVRFSRAVTRVDTAAPFADFSLTKTGITGGLIIAVSGSGSLYTVTARTGSNNGTLRLNVLDNDSILDGSGNSLGGLGTGNGNFLAGQTYTIKKIAVGISPASISIWDQTPTYKWSTIPGATKYSYQLWKGTMLVYTKDVLPGTCGTAACLNTPSNVLLPGAYKWRVRALTEGTWKPFSSYKTFMILGAKAGYWKGSGVDFYVTSSQISVANYSIYISVSGCGNYKITRSNPVPIVNGKFKFSGSFYGFGTFNGTSNPVTRVSGEFGLYYFYIPDCGYVSGGPFEWSATWRSYAQPDPAATAPSFLLLPEVDTPFPGNFSVDPLP